MVTRRFVLRRRHCTVMKAEQWRSRTRRSQQPAYCVTRDEAWVMWAYIMTINLTKVVILSIFIAHVTNRHSFLFVIVVKLNNLYTSIENITPTITMTLKIDSYHLTRHTIGVADKVVIQLNVDDCILFSERVDTTDIKLKRKKVFFAQNNLL